jgi:hypothetical protein
MQKLSELGSFKIENNQPFKGKKMKAKNVKENLESELSKQHACYVLITCDHPDKEGQMKINMSYQGDQALASYLVEGAQAYLEDPKA